ncbi:MAG: KpsF/GutQ family sugar-phosphate isomerase [Flavobacteriales bacterium]|nr:KpsF/GutQ family sugar-phosphate isomerase [Flavobacteriales bacterium]
MEADAIARLIEYVNDDFEQVVHLILNSKGRVVLTGIGKSANIANKTVATLNSTGTPAIFMHAADAIHGDLGNVQDDDVVICASKSGNSPEIKMLIPLVKNLGNPVVAMVGNLDSFLAQHSDHVINCSVEQEACPYNLAPTTSSATQLAMGDALAMALMDARGFTARDFAKYHPGGSLGKRLYTRVGDLLSPEAAPKVGRKAPMSEVIMAMSAGRVGATAVVDGQAVVGMITDGDLRRMMERNADFSKSNAESIMSTAPKTLEAEELAVRAFDMMESHNITQIIVTREGHYAGIVHLHDILKEGIY